MLYKPKPYGGLWETFKQAALSRRFHGFWTSLLTLLFFRRFWLNCARFLDLQQKRDEFDGNSLQKTAVLVCGSLFCVVEVWKESWLIGLLRIPSGQPWPTLTEPNVLLCWETINFPMFRQIINTHMFPSWEASQRWECEIVVWCVCVHVCVCVCVCVNELVETL